MEFPIILVALYKMTSRINKNLKRESYIEPRGMNK